MKKTVLSVLSLLLCAALFGSCTSAPEKRTGSGSIDQSASVSDILAAAETDAQPSNAPGETASASETPTPAASVPADTQPVTAEEAGQYASHSPEAEITRYTEYDVDLTAMSSTMVYSEVYDMMCYPENYVGKTIKMEGAFAVYEGEDRNYYACIIADATACCAQGVEFVLADDLAWPSDYPAPDTDVTVAGVFDTYYEGDWLYCQLIDAQIVF